MQAAGGVDDDDVGAPRHAGIEGVEDDRRWIGTGRMGDDRHGRAARPRSRAARWPQRGRCRPRPAGRAGRWTLKRAASLAMVVVLPVPLTPTTRITAGWSGSGRGGAQATSGRDTSRLAQLRLDSRHRRGLRAPPGGGDDLDGQPRPEVGGDERLLDLLPGSLVRARPGSSAGVRRSRGWVAPATTSRPWPPMPPSVLAAGLTVGGYVDRRPRRAVGRWRRGVGIGRRSREPAASVSAGASAFDRAEHRQPPTAATSSVASASRSEMMRLTASSPMVTP